MAILIPIDVLLIMSLAFIPYVTRKTELFGFTLPSEKTDMSQLMALRASYRNQMLVAGAALIVASIVLATTLAPDSALSINLVSALIFTYLIVGFLLYLPKHFKMLSLQKEQGWDSPSVPAVIVADTRPAGTDAVSPT